MRLAGKVALITGAATGVAGELMGFGGTTARLFVREGARVVVTDINEGAGESTAAQIREAGGEAVFVRHDVTSEADWIGAAKVAVSSFGRLDVLVNNAGTSARSTVEDTSIEVWNAQMDIHAKAAFLGMKYAIPEMRRAGGGSIVNLSSIYGNIGSPASTAYNAAKGAVRILTKSAAIQYAGENIRVNSVHPGYCWTPMAVADFPDDKGQQELMKEIPMGRWGSAEDIASGILFLASDESSYVTGAELIIDGGVTAQ